MRELCFRRLTVTSRTAPRRRDALSSSGRTASVPRRRAVTERRPTGQPGPEQRTLTVTPRTAPVSLRTRARVPRRWRSQRATTSPPTSGGRRAEGGGGGGGTGSSTPHDAVAGDGSRLPAGSDATTRIVCRPTASPSRSSGGAHGVTGAESSEHPNAAPRSDSKSIRALVSVVAPEGKPVIRV